MITLIASIAVSIVISFVISVIICISFKNNIVSIFLGYIENESVKKELNDLSRS